MKNQYCTACVHSDVCMFKDDYMRAKHYIEEELKETEIWSVLGSKHFTYELKCNHYSSFTPTIKNLTRDTVLSTESMCGGPGYRAKD